MTDLEAMEQRLTAMYASVDVPQALRHRVPVAPPTRRRWQIPRVTDPARRVRHAPTLAALAVGVVAAASVVGARALHPTGTGSDRSPAAVVPPAPFRLGIVPGKGSASLQGHGTAPSSPIGIVARMADGHTPAELTREGYTVWDAASSKLGAPASPTAGGLVSLPFYDHGAPVNLERLQQNPAVAAAGYVRAQSTDPSLQSHDYRLEDRPATQRFLIPAEAAMVAGGFVTRAQIDDGSTILLISDDPINAGQLIVTVDISGPLVTNRPAPPNSHSLIAVVAFMDRTSGQVLDVGFGSWNIVP